MPKRRLLLIEPDEKLSSIVTRFLGKADFEVTVVKDGLDGLQVASKCKPQVILIDMDLDNQEEGGLSLGKSFRGDIDLSKIPLVLMVSEEFEDEKPQRMKAIHRVFDGILYKPFADTELKRVVENFTGFGESDDMRKEQLDNLLGKNSPMNGDPDLKNLVKDLIDDEAGGSKKPSSKKKSKAGQESELEAERDSEKDSIIADRDKRIEKLLEKLSDMEMDHSFAVEGLETEINALKERVKELEKEIARMEEEFQAVSGHIENAYSVSRNIFKKKKS